MFCSLIGRKFSSKCKHSVKCIKCRMEAIRKKKQVMVRYLKKDVADLISGGHETNAFGRMDALIVEINQSSCYDMIEQYCCCIFEHLPTMQKERVCPEETVEAIATLIFAAARFPDLPELADLRKEFTKRYGTHMEAYINEEFVEKMQKKTFPQDKKLQLMHDIAQEFSVHWDFKPFEYKMSNLSSPTLDQPKIQFPSSKVHIKQEDLKKAENLDTTSQVSDVQKKQLESEKLINAENIKEYQKIIQRRRFEHHPHGSTEMIKNVELEDVKSYQFEGKAHINVQTKGQNTGEGSESVNEGLGSVGTEKQSADSMFSKDVKAINIIPPYTKFARDFNGLGSVGTEKQSADSMFSKDVKAVNIIPPSTKFARDFNGTSTNQVAFAHSITSEVGKEMDHNVQGNQINRTMNPESIRPFNLKPPYVKPKVTKSTSLETGYLMNTPSIRRAAINADFAVEDAHLVDKIPINQAGTVGKKNSMHGDVNDRQSFISPSSNQTEDDARNGAVYRHLHLQRAFSDRPGHGSRLS